MDLEKLIARRGEVYDQMEALLAKAIEGDRELEEAEEKEYQSLNTE